jgi:riboflavin kinase/FMN adenylyltransferase
MKIYRDPADVIAVPAERAVTIGAFDGVHLGHQAVLRLVHDLARARGLLATVLTFDRHPAEVVRPESAPKLLTNLDQKLELLDATGAVDECVVLTFDETRSKEPAEQFVEELLASVLHARLVVVGADFHFGYHRHGDVPLLQRMGAELGFETIGLGLVAPPGGVVGVPYSSTRVRELLAQGDIEAANAILGRPHELRVPIEAGVGRIPERLCAPAPGRYAADVDGQPAEVRVAGAEVQIEPPPADRANASIKFLARLP